MQLFSRLRPAVFGTSTTKPTEDTIPNEKQKELDAESAVSSPTQDDNEQTQQSEEERPDNEAQRGVQRAEAVTLTWSKPTLIAVFINVWLLYFVNAMQSSVSYSLIPFVTSSFSSHSLLNVIYIVANAMSAATYVPLAKVIDVWGRAEGYFIMCTFATLGLILMATCHNLATFCAAHVFYSIGFGGMVFCLAIITADSSKLKNRALAYAFINTPYIITAFAGAKAAEGFYYDISWRWGYGTFAIVFPVVAAPLFFVLKYNLRKAEKQGIIKKEKSDRTFLQSVWYYFIEFDIGGVIVFSVGLTVFLLPFNIASSAPNGWQTGYIIAMIIVGFVLLVAFSLYEKFLAPTPMLDFSILTDRTIIGACLINATYVISYFCWANYFTSFLQVVNNITLAESGYIGHTFEVVSGILLLGVGYLMRRTGYFKWLLYFAVPLYILAQGLMIYFRRPNQSVGFLVMCQVFTSIGGAVFIMIGQIAVLAAVDHQHIAAALAFLYVVGTIGNALGATICGAIWSNTFQPALAKYLPESELSNLPMIYSDLTTQLSYEVGSATRVAIQEAYGYAQTRMLSAGTAIMGLCFIWTLLIRNINLTKVEQVKGMVF
ncbi:major facilitator superfamily domain-containing protein [Phascolomyces articulosus]|uniref:Major facilitator superfamily domain-containing protein n=1 Tax=Phascolomyces articulosus TaxID=60185 RepID=A0AAD5PAX9_9FUNG|nr:major facilitator superfamily domain-containing protein [Phascolomyces articulosus]